MKNTCKNEIEINLDTIPENAYNMSHTGSAIARSTKSCWLCEKDFMSSKTCSKSDKTEDAHIVRREKRMVIDHCNLAGKFSGLANNECNSKTRRGLTSFVPILSHNLSRYDCNVIFGN